LLKQRAGLSALICERDISGTNAAVLFPEALASRSIGQRVHRLSSFGGGVYVVTSMYPIQVVPAHPPASPRARLTEPCQRYTMYTPYRVPIPFRAG